MQLHDQFGNVAEAGPDTPLAVEATGAACIAFDKASSNIFW